MTPRTLAIATRTLAVAYTAAACYFAVAFIGAASNGDTWGAIINAAFVPVNLWLVCGFLRVANEQTGGGKT